MTRPQAATNRFFVTSDFALYYRRAKQFHWQNQITSNYLVISVLTGQLDCLINETRTRVVEITVAHYRTECPRGCEGKARGVRLP
jgi:hypothetical protein